DIVRAAKRLKLKARIVQPSPKRLERLPLPAIIEKKDGSFALLAAASAGKVLLQDPQVGAPQELTREDFEARWSGHVILVTSRAFAHGFSRRFDFSWFIPEIIRYRWIFAEVLLASFFVQLLGLISPIFFQLVIDKVLVHNGLTTLEVLVIGLSAVSMFEVLLTGLRTYITIHTTSRIDVALGAKLFHHLLGLPIAYFEARQTGQTVARVHELENIRAFLTGSALTVLLDVLFLFVFLAVMYLYSGWLTLIVVCSIPAYVILSMVVTPEFCRRIEEKFNRGAENQTFLSCLLRCSWRLHLCYRRCGSPKQDCPADLKQDRAQRHGFEARGLIENAGHSHTKRGAKIGRGAVQPKDTPLCCGTALG
ncbi:ABC transporter transmembrane domain-containing protein, partial [Mesorhizobium sp. M1E.F.Ca.ET.063.01.1.1]|uniref:ABC transporter transmembrane domain-containing protein n=1 Tax=Mesorhizobium sp. M1E.F.Ca.ET.063.01.1.1 TaxID=2496750 RepID=UPI001FE22C77